MTSRYDPKEVSDDLEKMRSSMRFPNIEAPSNIDEIFQKLTNSNLSAMSATMLYEYSIRLAAYAIYVKKEINSSKAKYDWCEANIKYIVGKQMSQMVGNYYGYNEKDAYIRGNDPEAMKLDQMALTSKARLNSLYGLDEQIRFLSTQVNSLAKEKSYSRNMNV